MAALAEKVVVREQAPSLWTNRPFVAMITGRTVSFIGDGFHSVALGLWILQTTGSATAMATMMAVRIVISVLLGTPAGAVVDRTDRQRLMVGLNVVRFGIVAAMAWMMAVDTMPLWPIVLFTGLLATASSFYGPAAQASLITIVGKERVQQANGLFQVTGTLAQVVGPLLGGTVVAFLGGATAMAVDAATFLLAAVAMLIGGHFASPRSEGKQGRSLWSDMREGFAYIRTQPLVLSMVVIGPPIQFFATASFLLLPVIAVRIWQASPQEYGGLQTAISLGFALGAAGVMALTKRMARRGWWMIASILLTGVGMGLVALMPSVTLAFPVLFITGIVNAVVNVLLQAILQAEVAPEVQGRVFGTVGSIFNVASPAAMLMAGVLADRMSPVLLAAGSGALLVLSGIICVAFSPALRNYR